MMKRNSKDIWVFTAILLSSALPASAANWEITQSFCPEEIVLALSEQNVRPIPVGCEVVDCCPGCPKTDALDWRIRLEGPFAKSVVLKFTNMPPSAFKNLEIKGNAKLLDDSVVLISPGESRIVGFDLRRQDRPPTATPYFMINQPAVRRVLAASKEKEYSTDVDEIKLLIEQMLGPVIVNEFAINYKIAFNDCDGGEVPLDDFVELDSNSGGDRAVFLVDGRRIAETGASACINDQVQRGSNMIAIGNMIRRQGCHEQTVVFSQDDGMVSSRPPGGWTDIGGNRQKITLPDLRLANMTFWIMRKPFEGTEQRASMDAFRANEVLNSSKCGIGYFLITPVSDQTNNPNTNDLLSSDCDDRDPPVENVPKCVCDSLSGPLRSKIGFTQGHVNVYYLDDPAGLKGAFCSDGILIVGATADNETLAHELGHSFGLKHTNMPEPNLSVSVDYNDDGTADFSNSNIMWTNTTGRDTFSEGQCYRMNIDDCPDDAISDRCPWLGLDVVTE
jgi:hypothetical protein